MRKKVILIDLDGVLSKGESWNKKECLEAEPIEENIKKVNKLSKSNFIIIWTARNDSLIPSSLKWLRKHGVNFDAISNNKPPASFYVDDKAITLNRLLNS